nr:dehydrogenase [Agrobacterium vitis]
MQTKPIEPQVHDEAAHLIAWHDGDATAAIRTLLKDCRHLHEQLRLAAVAMGCGYTRGWMPTAEPKHLDVEATSTCCKET